MSVSYVEREQADEITTGFYDDAEGRFEMLLNIFKVLGHTPKLGKIFTDSVMEMLQDSYLDWPTKELLILKATHRNDCQYCVVQHEAVSQRLGISAEKIADIEGDKYNTSPQLHRCGAHAARPHRADRCGRQSRVKEPLGSAQR